MQRKDNHIMNLFIRQNKEDLLKMYPDKKRKAIIFFWIITDYFTGLS